MSESDSKAPRATKGRGILNKFVRFLLALGLVFGIIYTSTLNGEYNLQVYEPRAPAASVVRGSQEYRQFISQTINSSPLNSFKFTLNSKQIEQKITSQFPELKDASVSIPPFSRQLNIALVSDELVLILSANSQIYALNNQGYAKIEHKNLPRITNLNLPVVLDQSNTLVKEYSQALPASQVEYILEVKRHLDAKGIKIDSFVLPADAPLELDLRPQNTPYIVKFSYDANASQSVGAYLALKQNLDENGTTPKEYIDVRLAEKVFYR